MITHTEALKLARIWGATCNGRDPKRNAQANHFLNDYLREFREQHGLEARRGIEISLASVAWEAAQKMREREG